jgi:hypothetical protein
MGKVAISKRGEIHRHPNCNGDPTDPIARTLRRDQPAHHEKCLEAHCPQGSAHVGPKGSFGGLNRTAALQERSAEHKKKSG